MKILVTGFDPFGGETVNPAFEAVKQLPDRIGDTEIIKQEIPTVFDRAGEVLLQTIKETAPDAVLCVGQAGGRSGITVERIAVNLRDARIADNAGAQPVDQPVVPGGPAAFFATVPVKAMVQAVQASGVPASVSNSAGTFVCNDLLYTALYHTAGTAVRCGFIHVPFATAQAVTKPANTPSMSLDDMTKALTAALTAIIEA